MGEEQAHEEPAAAESLLQNYSAGAGIFDELEEAPSRLRPHWRPFIQALERLGRHELTSRWENGRRIIRAHGVTYNQYGDPQGMERPWGLDFVPLLITAKEWSQIEAGLIQRARLFNLILADVYSGPQRLLRDGFLPPELIYANPAFLRCCRGIPVPRQVYLHLHACDLGRAPDGQWWVMSDRTQVPSGTGYTWENRTVVSRILPEPLRECNVQRLGDFFREQRDMLFNLAPPGRDSPRIVLLTPGPHNETYFEHAFLARHLGFPLVEGADLTVRDRRVFLKTIEGLQAVDVILRRVDDLYCDPLELRSDSFLGVAGLVEATRAGHVTLANALGAGLMESPALLGFIPALCRHLLDEELLLPSVATWWCGQAQELRYVTEHLDSLILKPAFSSQNPLPGRAVRSAKARRKAAEMEARVRQNIQAAPHEFVAQERLNLSRAPSWVDGQLTARPVVVRAYMAHGGDAFVVLPGGLTRVSRDPENLAMSRPGVESKDTWVLSNGAVNRPEPAYLLSELRPGENLSVGVPSRVADHLFWLGRYTERLEQLLRVLRCVLGRASGEISGEGERGALAELAAHLGYFWTRGPEAHSHELYQRMLQLLYEEEQGGVRDLLKRIRLITSAVRDRFSGDTWRILGRLDADSHSRPGRLPIASATALIHNLVLDLAAFNGMEMENMTRGRGWRFLDFGRRLERGLSVIRLVQAALSAKSQGAAVLEPVLEIADSVMTYRRQYFAAPRLHGVLGLVLRDETNPRSLAFQVQMLREHAAALVDQARSAPPEAEHERIHTLADTLTRTDLSELAAQHVQGTTQPLQDLLGAWAADLWTLSDEVTSRYFSHSVPQTSST